MGYVDGLLVSPLLGVNKDKLEWVETLIKGMNSEQITAIMLTYLESNPEIWNEGFNSIAYRALRKAYEKKYGPIKE